MNSRGSIPCTPINLNREDFELLLEETLDVDFPEPEESFKRGRVQRLALQISNVYLRSFIQKGAA